MKDPRKLMLALAELSDERYREGAMDRLREELILRQCAPHAVGAVVSLYDRTIASYGKPEYAGNVMLVNDLLTKLKSGLELKEDGSWKIAES